MKPSMSQFSDNYDMKNSADFKTELGKVCDDIVVLGGKKTVAKNRKKPEINSFCRDAYKTNKNISSIISRIRDEGSAFDTGGSAVDDLDMVNSEIEKYLMTDTDVAAAGISKSRQNIKKDNVMKLNCKKNKKADKTQNEEHSADEKIRINSIEVDNQAVTADIYSAEKKHPQLMPYAITIVAMVFTAIISYQFKIQSDEIKNTLTLYKQAIKNKDMGYKDRFDQVDILQAPKEAKQNLTLLNKEYRKPKKVSGISDELKKLDVKNQKQKKFITKPLSGKQEHSDKVQSKRLAYNFMNNRIMSNRPSIQHIKKKAKSQRVANIRLNKNIPSARLKIILSPTLKKSENNAAKKITSVIVSSLEKAPRLVIFAVNLASFSDRETAVKQQYKLQRDGVNAIIEPAVINSRKIFRLAVDGFANRDEADDFILQARKKYAMKGWVRHS